MSSCLSFIFGLLFASLCLGAPTPITEANASTPHTNTMPLNDLPSPSALSLRHIALGLGTQNYSCSSAGATPSSIGALAVLYDATFLSQPASADSIPTYAALAYATQSSLGLPTLGHHWFSANNVPTFDLEAAEPHRMYLSAKKVADVDAPEKSIAGSVDWLFLEDDGRGVSVGLKAVYRIETAGGSPPATCEKEGHLQVKYAAEYWFYG